MRIDWHDRDGWPDRKFTALSALRWTAAVVIVTATHAGAIWMAVDWKSPAEAAGEPPAAVMIELAPFAVSPEAPPQDVAPGPEMTEAQAEPTPTEPPKKEEKPDEKPDPVVQETVEQPIEKLPEKPNAEAVLTPTPERPKPEPVKKKPPPKAKTAEKKKPIDPKKKSAPQTTAPPTSRAQRADRAAAPFSSSSPESSMSPASWRGALMAHLNRHKRFPAGAASTGVVTVAFTIDRSGRVLSARLVRGSGDAALDNEAVALARRASGRLWVDRLREGLVATDDVLIPADGERIVRLVAHHVGAEVHPGSPRVSAELPETGERFEGLLPPVVMAPTFAIRKPAVAVFTLADYVAGGIMTAAQADVLRLAVERRKNILVAGGTSTGKTTLTNALLAEVAKTSDRVVLIEDTRELQCAAPNLVALRTKDGVASLSDLVKSSLRLRPDRIPVGEVRGSEALDLLKAWGTGHPGGVGTIHANTALGALRRLEQLVQEAVVTVPRALIAETIDIVAVLSGRGAERRLAEIAHVDGLDPATGDYRTLNALLPTPNPSTGDPE